jgi:hypothetical protein
VFSNSCGSRNSYVYAVSTRICHLCASYPSPAAVQQVAAIVEGEHAIISRAVVRHAKHASRVCGEDALALAPKHPRGRSWHSIRPLRRRSVRLTCIYSVPNVRCQFATLRNGCRDSSRFRNAFDLRPFAASIWVWQKVSSETASRRRPAIRAAIDNVFSLEATAGCDRVLTVLLTAALTAFLDIRITTMAL